ncbi:MmpS family transport accessory protein [Rhodococcus sp. ABRD24]|uniref:MmpS family transport accessory protein n=1 Tax=Rhodococcus sp. ABRD24 TaxID=2507582 RepID=UPI00325BE9D6
MAATTLPPLKAAAPSGKGKQIQYGAISDSASLNSVTWFDENNSLQQSSSASAPWSLELTNTSSFVTAGVTAQTDGTSVTCRVVVDGKVEMRRRQPASMPW